MSGGEGPLILMASDAPLDFELAKGLTEVLVSNSKKSAQLKLTLRPGGELIEDALCERGF